MMRLAGYDINLSASMPIGIYALTNDSVAIGQIVAVCLSPEIARIGRERGYLHAGPCESGDQPVLKYVTAMAGDSIDVQPAGVTINSRVIPNSAVMERDRHGRPLPHVPWGTITLQHEQVWLMSTQQPNSWDSRYYGPVQVANIVVVVRPVLVTTRAGGSG
jgi:conjugative transfer signal peptidase TraF